MEITGRGKTLSNQFRADNSAFSGQETTACLHREEWPRENKEYRRNRAPLNKVRTNTLSRAGRNCSRNAAIDSFIAETPLALPRVWLGSDETEDSSIPSVRFSKNDAKIAIHVPCFVDATQDLR